MASGVLRISDVVVPAIFTPMVRRMTTEKINLIRSGAAFEDPILDNFLQGAGVTVNMPKMNPLDSGDVENVSSDDPTVFSTPNKPSTASEIAVRLSRNNSWSQMDLTRSILAADPLAMVADQVSTYWAQRRQRAIIAHIAGIFADNAAAPTAGEHVQNDMTVNLSTLNTNTYLKGVTDFHGSAFIDAFVTLGDSMGDVAVTVMHSIVYATALKNDLIAFRVDSEGKASIPTYMGRDVVMDDAMPVSGGVFETWLVGRGAIGIGSSSPDVPTEILRIPGAGNGGGQEVMWDRVEWAHHLSGTSYVGTAPNGGPSNAATTNNLAHLDSWKRVGVTRKYIPLARLITREF